MQLLESLDYEPPFLKEIIDQNVQGLDFLQNIARERKKDLQDRMDFQRYVEIREEAAFCDFLSWYTALREHFLDNLERGIKQRKDPDVSKYFKIIDKVVLDILGDIGKDDRLISIYSKGAYFAEFATKTISFPASDLENPLCYAILAHEVTHTTLASLALSLQTLLYQTIYIKEEFSRRFGVKRFFLDKLIGTDPNSREAKALIDDFRHYFRTHEEGIIAFINQLRERIRYEPERKQREVSHEIFEKVIHFFIPSLMRHISVIEDYISKEVNEDWISEVMADIVATKIMGPIYFESLFENLWITERTNLKVSHPPTTFRLFLVEKTLDLMDLEENAFSHLRKWREAFPQINLKELNENEKFLKDLFNFVNDHLKKINAPRCFFKSADYSESISISDDLQRGELVLKSKRSAVILNAASIAIRKGGDPKIVNKAVVEFLTKKY